MISPERRTAAQPQVQASVGTTETSPGTAATPGPPPGGAVGPADGGLRCGRWKTRPPHASATSGYLAFHPPAALPPLALSTSLSPDGQSGGLFFSSLLPPCDHADYLALKIQLKAFPTSELLGP